MIKRDEIIQKMIEVGPDDCYIVNSNGWILVLNPGENQQVYKIHGNSVIALLNDHMIDHDDSCLRLRDDFYNVSK